MQFYYCESNDYFQLDANGNILVDKVLESFHDDLVAKYEKPMRECNDIVSHAGDTLDYIYNYCYCAYEKTKEVFLLKYSVFSYMYY